MRELFCSGRAFAPVGSLSFCTLPHGLAAMALCLRPSGPVLEDGDSARVGFPTLVACLFL